jgi:hypothetical protein
MVGSMPPAVVSGWRLATRAEIFYTRRIDTSTIVRSLPRSMGSWKTFNLELGTALAAMLETHAPNNEPSGAAISTVTHCSGIPAGGKSTTSSPPCVPAIPPMPIPICAPCTASVFLRDGRLGQLRRQHDGPGEKTDMPNLNARQQHLVQHATRAFDVGQQESTACDAST